MGQALNDNSNLLIGLGAGIASGNPAWVSTALQGAAAGAKADKAERDQRTALASMYQALISRGYPASQALAIAQHAAVDPKIAEALLPQALGLKPPATIEALIAEQASRGANGNGGVSLPGAINLATDYKQRMAQAEKAGQTIGEKQATAQLDLPSAVANAQEQLRLIDELRNHPGRDQVGWHDLLATQPLIPASKGYDAQKLLDQIKGGAFLTAYQTLKGAGAITEVEGQKATNAIARMDRAQSRAEFDKALTDYSGVIKLGIDKVSQMAGQQPPNNFRGNAPWQQLAPGIRIRQVQ
jgi:hypothetical protein